MEPATRSSRPVSFWLAIVLALMFGVSALANIVLAGLHMMGREGAPFDHQEHFMAGNLDASDKVLHIPLAGTIMDMDTSGGLSPSPSIVSRIAAQLQQARKDEKVKAILLEVNSPGGGVTASDILYHEVDRFRQERKIPVVVLCRDVTASGGYYVAMAADHVMAHHTSVIGSIGVIAELANVEGLMQKVGVQMNVIKSQRADGSESFKDIGSPFRPMKPAERALMQTIIQRMWGRFVDVVAAGRKGKLSRDQVAALADGRVWTGQQALELKLIDSLGYRDDALKKAQELAGLSSAKLVSWHPRPTLVAELLSSRSDLTQVTALLEQAFDPGARTSPRLMYLWSLR